jgi:general secretion pathway protein B
MSYILEALRRAERERQLGQAPTVQTLAQATPWQPAQQQRQLIRGALAILTVLLLGLALWLALRPTAPAAPHATDTETPAAASVSAPQAPPLPVKETVVSAAEAATVIEADENLASLDDVTAPFGSNPAASTTIITPAAPAESAPAATAAAPSVEQPAATAPPQPSTQVETLTLAPAPPRLLRDMPASYRAGFPAISMDVHVYDSDAARRWILVDGRRYREGDTLAAGPRIAEIISDGVVLEHGGERVRLPLNR